MLEMGAKRGFGANFRPWFCRRVVLIKIVLEGVKLAGGGGGKLRIWIRKC